MNRLANAALAAALCSISAFASAETVTTPAVDSITKPIWLEQPTGVGLKDNFPPKALRWGVSGRAVLRCTADQGGHLKGCAVTSEFPKTWDFGLATLQMAGKFRLQTEDGDGRAVFGRHVDVAIKWTLSKQSPGERATYRNSQRLVAWSAVPSPSDAAAAYPDGVAGPGMAILKCGVDATGHLANCIALADAPVYRGFGAAALKLAPLFRLASDDAAPAPGTEIILPIDLQPPTDALWDEDQPFIAAGKSIIGADQPYPAPKPRVLPILRLPTADDLAALYPPSASARQEPGGAKLGCTVSVEGALENCVVMQENPPFEGFGYAALAASKFVKLRTTDDNGRTNVGRVFRMVFSFKHAS